MTTLQPLERVKRPVATLHLPLELGVVASVLKAVAAEYPSAKLANAEAETTLEDGTTYHTDEGRAIVVLVEVEP